MDFKATTEQEAMQDSVRRLVARTIRPLLDSQDRNHTLEKPHYLEILGKLAGMGLTAARLPRSLGGPGLEMIAYGMMIELLPAPIAVSLIAHEVTLSRLGAECSQEQRQRLLPDLIAGRKIACTGSTEPDTGSDPRGIKTRLSQKGGKLVLNGRKMWITNVSACDVMLATCLDQRTGASGSKVIMSCWSARTHPSRRMRLTPSASDKACSENACSRIAKYRPRMSSKGRRAEPRC